MFPACTCSARLQEHCTCVSNFTCTLESNRSQQYYSTIVSNATTVLNNEQYYNEKRYMKKF